MTVIVTAAVIEKNGKVLIAQRKPGDKLGLKWEFPGGKLEDGESPEECIVREIREELDICIKVQDIFKVVYLPYHAHDGKWILLLAYKCSVVSGEPRTVDCHDFRWVSPQELAGYDFPAADLPIVEKLVKPCDG